VIIEPLLEGIVVALHYRMKLGCDLIEAGISTASLMGTRQAVERPKSLGSRPGRVIVETNCLT